MKTKIILLLLIGLFISGNAEAQIFKKLKEKIAKEVFNKEEKTDSDSRLKEMMGEPIPAPEDNNIKLPESYTFSYQATMQVTNNKGTVETEYYLEPEENYYAKKNTNKDFTEYVVYDNQRSMEVYFAEFKGEKKKARKKMDIFTKAKMVGAYRDAPNRTVKTIGNKTLLGYTCNGYEITTDAGTTQLWVTNDAPATMYSAMFTHRAKEPDSPFTKNTMIMEVSFIAAKDSNSNYQMAFTQLQANTLVFSNNDYKN